MTEQGREPSIVESWADDPLAALAAAAAGVAAGVAFATLLRKEAYTLTGDEAPIRVRNGFLHIELLHVGQVFRDTGGGKNWEINWKGSPTRPVRAREKYTVLALPADLSTCRNGLVLIGGRVVFTHEDGKKIQFIAAGRRTQIVSPPLNQPTGKPGSVEYQAAGEIQQVAVDQTILYERSTTGDSSLQILLLDL